MAVNYFSTSCNISLHALNGVRSEEGKDLVAINNFLKTVVYLALTATRNGEINLASICSSGLRCSALGRLEFVQLQPLTGCIRKKGRI
jgi:hypothetical protein